MLVGLIFVDDTDRFVIGNLDQNALESVGALQRAVNTWHGGSTETKQVLMVNIGTPMGIWQGFYTPQI